MSIVAAEIKLMKAVVNDDTGSNGGRMSTTEAVSGVKNNVWPDVPQAERAAGSTKYRKCFYKIENDTDLAMYTPKLFMETPSPGDDAVLLFPATQTDDQSSITGSERLYGAGTLNADVLAGVNSIVVNTESATHDIFVAGDPVRISDMVDVDDVVNNEEYHIIAVGGVSAYTGDQVTLTLESNLANGYTAAVTRIASVIAGATIETVQSGVAVTSASGTYDDATYPVIGDNIGTVEDTWTLTFTSGTAFDAVGANSGAVGSGNTSGDFMPVNGDFAKPYFMLGFAGFGGTFLAGDTLVFTSSPASMPYWEKRVVPVGAASLSANSVIVALDGESA